MSTLAIVATALWVALVVELAPLVEARALPELYRHLQLQSEVSIPDRCAESI